VGARRLDQQIREMLDETQSEYRVFPGSLESADAIADLIELRLEVLKGART